MSSLRQLVIEAVHESDEAAAKKGFDSLMDAAGTVGSFRGNVRVYERHKGGTLERTLVGDHNSFSYAKPTRYSGSGHYFATHYSARPGHNVYVHVKLPRNFDLSNKESLEAEIERQNPHTKNTGHGTNLANSIIKYHGRVGQLVGPADS